MSPTTMEVEQSKDCEYREVCCEAGHGCAHPRRVGADLLNAHCEDFVREGTCPFLSGELV